MPKALGFCPIVAFLIVAVTPPAFAQWQEELSEQIAEELDCEVSFLSQVIEREVEGQRVILAKVHCIDKRAYDAYRGDDHDLFEFRLCGEQDVSAC